MVQAGFYKPTADNTTHTGNCTMTTACQPIVEFVVNEATTTIDTQCAPVAVVELFFSPMVPLAAVDPSGLALQAAIVTAIVNQTNLR